MHHANDERQTPIHPDASPLEHRLRGAWLVVLAMLVTMSAQAAEPIVIAHRGASGYLPEHTLPAYALAYGLGADYIEPDLVMTRDGELICLHDIHLEDTTDVEQRFPDRRRQDGHWYPADFDLAEIRTLRAHERLEGRFPQDAASRFSVPTFREMVELVQALNRATGRTVGIYPELKAPAWHRAEGLPMEEAFLAIVRGYGYEGPAAPIFVQCFELEPLERMRELGSALPQIFLAGDNDETRQRLQAAGLERIAAVANGIGPSKDLIEADPSLMARAHALGLKVHPYTFRVDDVGRKYRSFEDEVRTFFEKYEVDGLFTDFPDRALAVRDGTHR